MPNVHCWVLGGAMLVALWPANAVARGDECTDLIEAGWLAHNQGRFAEAEVKFAAAAEQLPRLGCGEELMATLWNNQGVLYISLRRYIEARTLLEKALDARKKLLGEDNPGVAVTLHNLGDLERLQGNFQPAEDYYRRSLQMWLKALGPDDPVVAANLCNTGELLRMQRKYSGAETSYRRALDIMRRALPAGDERIATCLNNLGCNYSEQRKYDAARKRYVEALTVLRQGSKSSVHPTAAMALLNLAEDEREMGNHSEAEQYYRESISVWEQLYGVQSPALARYLNRLADVCRFQGRFGESEQLYRRALALQENRQGKADPVMIASLESLAALFDDVGNHPEAERMKARARSLRN